MTLQSGPAAWAPVIIAVATLITALAGAIAVIFNAVRAKRIETKLDTATVVQGEIHHAVNGGLQAAKDEIAALKAEILRLQPPDAL